MKAFVINVIGDVGLVLAAFLIFRELGVFNYVEVFESAHDRLRAALADAGNATPEQAGQSSGGQSSGGQAGPRPPYPGPRPGPR